MTRFLFVLLLLNTHFASAQDTLQLNPVTVTATLNAVQSLQTGRNIAVIHNEEIRSLPVNSIDELLRYLPGLEVQSRGPKGSQSDLSIRGSTYQQVLVILDGMRLNDPLTGHFSAYVPVAPAEIERIEILKGAASAVYGTEAVGGVVNVITKAFAAQANEPHASVQAQALLGEYGLSSTGVGGAYSDGRSAVSGGVLSNEAEGQQLRGMRGFFNLRTASLSASHRLRNWQLAARAAYDDRSFAAQNFYTPYKSDSATERVKSLWNQARLSYRKNNHDVQWHLGYKTTEDVYQYIPGIAANENQMQLAQTSVTWNHGFSEKTNITTGTQYQNRSIQSNDRGNHDVQQAAAFAILDQRVGKSLHVSPALRYDWNQNGGSEWVPQLNLSYHRKDLQLRAGIGKTTREPDFTERYNNFNKLIVPNGGSLGNPDLQAERGLAYEAGADYLWAHPLKVSVTAFQRRYEKLIDWVSTPYAGMPYKHNLIDSGIYALASNIANVTTTGAEIDVHYVRALNDKCKIRLATGFLYTDNQGDEETPAFYLTSQAKYLINGSIALTSPRFSIGASGLYKQRVAKDAPAIEATVSSDYFVLNVRAEVFLLKNKLAALVQVDNALDKQYSDLLGAQMPRRWLIGGLRLQL